MSNSEVGYNYPRIIQDPYNFEWRVGDRVERTNTETDSVTLDTIARIITYKYPTGPLAVNVKNQSVVFSLHQEDRYGPFSYRLLSRQTPRPRPEVVLPVGFSSMVVTDDESVIIGTYRAMPTKDKEIIKRIMYAFNVAHRPRL